MKRESWRRLWLGLTVGQYEAARRLGSTDEVESSLLNYGDGPRAIYEVLKQQIISGKLEAGSELKIMSLASELGVSIVPVREAIRILAAEDLVVLRPRRSPIIAKLDQSDFVEVNLIRRALEPVVLEEAIPNHTADTLAACEAILEQDRSCQDHWERIELNERFHMALLAPSTLKRTISIITDQYVGIARIMHFRIVDYLAKDPDLVKQPQEEHAAILNAVKLGNQVLATDLLKKHIDNATRRPLSD